MKTFYYSIPEIHVSNPIFVDVNEYPTISDLERKIESDLHISKGRLVINNATSENRLEKISESTSFQMKFDHLYTNYIFSYLGTKINLQSCEKMNFYSIIDSFREKNIYFSKECTEKNILLYALNKELPKIEFPILAAPKYTNSIDVKVNCQLVTLRYGQKEFNFCENEPVFNAYDLIKRVFKGCKSVIISNDRPIKINLADKLKKNVFYNIRVDFRFTFKSIENDFSEEILCLDFLITTSQSKKELAKKLSVYTRVVEPESIILFNNKKVKIYSDKLLNSIQNFNEPFYYEITNRKKVTQSPERNYNGYYKEYNSHLFVSSSDSKCSIINNKITKETSNNECDNDNEFNFIKQTESHAFKSKTPEINHKHLYNLNCNSSFNCPKKEFPFSSSERFQADVKKDNYENNQLVKNEVTSDEIINNIDHIQTQNQLIIKANQIEEEEEEASDVTFTLNLPGNDDQNLFEEEEEEEEKE